ncbi:MAG: WD40 repeat domain-containing protein [Pseudomonadota bacterium]
MSKTTSFSHPYPGIRPFRKSEWPLFFGRERMIDAVMERLAQSQFVLLHGTSGCGKSSLVKAGLLPRLETSHYGHGKTWQTTQMRPGGAPLWNLAEALARLIEGLDDDQEASLKTVRQVRRRLNRGTEALASIQAEFGLGLNGNVCLLIDQFEEVFRYAAQIERSEVEMLVNVLRAFDQDPPQGIHAIATMRSDFLGDCAKFVGFAEVVNHTQYLLPRLDERELMDSIIRPAEVCNGTVDPELALKLIDESRDEVDALPLVQHCLMYLWNRASQDLDGPVELRLDDYIGLKQTLSRRADEVLAELEVITPGNSWCAEHLFRAIIELDADGRATRRPERLSVLEGICSKNPEALDLHVKHFSDPDTGFVLLSRDEDPIVDITHESLIRCWDRLSLFDEYDSDGRPIGWLQRERDDARRWRALRLRVAEADGLIGEATIDDREKLVASLPGPAWAARYGGEWDDVNDLLVKSRAAIDLERKKKEQEHKRERQVLYGALAALVAVIGLAITSTYNYVSAANNRSLYQAELVANLVTDWDRALNPTLWEALDLDIDSADLRAQIGLHLLTEDDINLERVDGLSPELARDLAYKKRDFRVALQAIDPVFELKFANDEVDGVAVNSDGTRIAAGDDDGNVFVWGAPSKTYTKDDMTQLVHIAAAHSDQVGQVRFNPLGQELLSVGYDGRAKVWDSETGRLISEVNAPGRNWGSAWSKDGTLIATGADRGTARVFRWQEGPDPIYEAKTRSELAMGVAFNPTSDRIAVAPLKEGIQIHDLASLDGVPERTIGGGELFSVEWSPDGQYIASGLDNGDMIVWTADGTEVARMNNAEAARGLSFHPDSTYLATGSDAGEARVWSIPDGALVAELRGHSNDVDAITWTADGSHIVTGTDSGYLRIFKFQEADLSTPFAEVISSAVKRFADSQTVAETMGGQTDCLTRDQWANLVNASIAPDWCRTLSERAADFVARIGDPANANIQADLEGLLGLVPEPTAFTYLAEAASTARVRVSGEANRSAVSNRLIDAARSLSIAAEPEHAAQLALLTFNNQPGASDIEALLALEAVSAMELADGAAIAGHADAATVFAQVLDPLSPTSHTSQIRSLSTDAGDANLAAASNNGVVLLWDLTAGTVRDLFRSASDAIIYEAAINPRGTQIAVALAERRFILFDLLNDDALVTFLTDVKDPRSVDWSADGRYLATGGDDEVARVWDMMSADTPTLVSVMEGHNGGVRTLALSPDGQDLITGASDATARLWNSLTGQVRMQFSRGGTVTAVDYSDDGTKLAIGGADNQVEIRDAKSGDLLHEIELAANVEEVAFGPDSQTLAIASLNVSVWNVADGQRKLTLDIEDVTALAWGADGDSLLTGTRDGDVTRWSFGAEALNAAVSERAIRCLTPEERQAWQLTDVAPDWCARFAAAR